MSNCWASLGNIDLHLKSSKCGDLLFDQGAKIDGLFKVKLADCKNSLKIARFWQGSDGAKGLKAAQKQYEDMLLHQELYWT